MCVYVCVCVQNETADIHKLSLHICVIVCVFVCTYIMLPSLLWFCNDDNNNVNNHLLDLTVPTPLTTELPPTKTGQHLEKQFLF